MSINDEQIARRFDDLIGFANGLGFERIDFLRIVDEVEAEARVSATWGTLEERFAEIRRRLLDRAASR